MSGGKARPRRQLWVWLAVVILLGVGIYFFARRGGGAKSGSSSSASAGARTRGFGAIPVVAARARKSDIGVYLPCLGAVTPIYTVTVNSRVDGQLMKVYYQEGDVVRQGDPLVEIDPRPYAVMLTQAEGQRIKDQALLDNARIDLARYQTLLTQNAVPEQQVATQKALVAQYEGAVKTDQGQIDSAKLDLVYCHITAPITGRVGLRLVDPGNIVHAADTNGLLVITQVQPISVIFTLAEDQLPTVVQKMRAGRRLRVDIYDHAMTTKIATGSLATLDNQIDQTTGTVKLRAIFDNQDKALFPNQFVNARLLVEEKHGVTLLSTAAIQRNSQMTYVYVVRPDSTVTVRPVAVGTTEGDQSEITSGLAPGEAVVMTGVDKLQEGSKVSAQVDGDSSRRGR
ncbi:MAG: MdtA/MuxA family multidrug efflux RND transporter periplasmic adaptor subunit [Terriglobia bacterium]|jgi:multidrug efflux system membrane fusion protein